MIRRVVHVQYEDSILIPHVFSYVFGCRFHTILDVISFSLLKFEHFPFTVLSPTYIILLSVEL